MKDHLLEFLKSWLAWAEAGGQGPEYTQDGLCCQIGDFIRINKSVSDWEREDMEVRLRHMLPMGMYPFNSLDALAYSKECCDEAVHLNPRRLAWVRQTIKELEQCK